MICISCFHRYKRFMFPILSSIRFDDGITILELVYLYIMYMVENNEQNAMSKIKITIGKTRLAGSHLAILDFTPLAIIRPICNVKDNT